MYTHCSDTAGNIKLRFRLLFTQVNTSYALATEGSKPNKRVALAVKGHRPMALRPAIKFDRFVANVLLLSFHDKVSARVRPQSHDQTGTLSGPSSTVRVWSKLSISVDGNRATGFAIRTEHPFQLERSFHEFRETADLPLAEDTLLPAWRPRKNSHWLLPVPLRTHTRMHSFHSSCWILQ